MGFGKIVKSVGKVALAPIKSVGGAIFGGAGIDSPPGQSGALTTTRGDQLKKAQQFREGIPVLANERMGVEAQGARRELAGNLAGIKQSANSRGLLYSGLREGAEADTRGGYAAALAQRRSQLNQEMDDQATDMEQTALAGAYDDQAAGQRGLDDKFNARQERNAARDRLIGSIAAGVGKAAGAAAGGA